MHIRGSLDTEMSYYLISKTQFTMEENETYLIIQRFPLTSMKNREARKIDSLLFSICHEKGGIPYIHRLCDCLLYICVFICWLTVLQEIQRLESELGHLPQKWRPLWDRLEHPARESLTRQVSFNTAVVRCVASTLFFS